jgi:hypothetical protein
MAHFDFLLGGRNDPIGIRKLVLTVGIPDLLRSIAKRRSARRQPVGSPGIETMRDVGIGSRYQDYAASAMLNAAPASRLHGIADAERWRLPR